MIEYKTGNIFDEDVEALVNPVNCMGVMGAGLAKEFKIRFPDYFEDYKDLCELGCMNLGKVAFHFMGGYRPALTIISFPTKLHWKAPSQLSYIEEGLSNLTRRLQANLVNSVAIPPLGCGLGGLDWKEVKPLIEAAFSIPEMQNVKVVVFEPLTHT